MAQDGSARGRLGSDVPGDAVSSGEFGTAACASICNALSPPSPALEPELVSIGSGGVSAGACNGGT
jgi:hypothetical protein